MATIDKRLSDLEARTSVDERRWGPPICTWHEDADGSNLKRDSQRCMVGLESPTSEDCKGCRAHKIIMTFVSTDEDIVLSESRMGQERDFVP